PVGFSSVPGGRVTAQNDSYSLRDRMSYRIKYGALSDIGAPSPRELRLDRSPDEEDMGAYLQLPRLSGRVKDLADEITSDEDNRYDKAIAVKRYLLGNYSYTRTLERGSSDYPLEEFLFNVKKGHCEYFATAMVILLREAGVPSRIVNGFVGGTPNEHGNFYLIRESDAHSWVEVYFPEHGWVSFDPTPEAGDAPSVGILAVAASYIDYFRFRWNRYVIDFSERDQMRLLSDARDRWRFRSKSLFRVEGLKSALDKRVALFVALILAAAWLAVSRPGIRSLLRLRESSPRREASALYEEALRFLSRKGFPKPGSMTAGEYSESLARSSCPQAPAMKALTGKYLSLRFGTSGDGEEIKTLARLLGELKRVKA
ncbi:MAG TPA: transglutaminase domain-containing protein, partial [Thermodesulfobacteriota bacterium]|nr:transglutaminase domain-containing protein [Thermodesulfobacteriota bacterium]